MKPDFIQIYGSKDSPALTTSLAVQAVFVGTTEVPRQATALLETTKTTRVLWECVTWEQGTPDTERTSNWKWLSQWKTNHRGSEESSKAFYYSLWQVQLLLCLT